MKQVNVKIVLILVLISLTIISLNLFAGSMTIEGKGRGCTTYDLTTGEWEYYCDSHNDLKCTLTVPIE